MHQLVGPAIDQLCVAFANGGYNPTPIIDLGVLVAYADGRVDDRERAMLSSIFQSLLDTTLTPEVVDHLVTASVEVIEAAGADSRARLVGAILRDCNAAEQGMVVALAVAFASEGLSAAEQKVVDRLADAAGLPRAKAAELAAKVRAVSDTNPISVRQVLASKPAT